MPEYRAYILNRENHFLGCEPLICADDDAAVAAAKRLLDGHDIELWQPDRKVTTLAHRPNGQMNAGQERKISHVAQTK